MSGRANLRGKHQALQFCMKGYCYILCRLVSWNRITLPPLDGKRKQFGPWVSLRPWCRLWGKFSPATNEKTAFWRRLSRNVVGITSFILPFGAGALLACNFIVLGAVPQVPAASLCKFAVIANILYSLVSHCKPLLFGCALLLQ